MGHQITYKFKMLYSDIKGGHSIKQTHVYVRMRVRVCVLYDYQKLDIQQVSSRTTNATCQGIKHSIPSQNMCDQDMEHTI